MMYAFTVVTTNMLPLSQAVVYSKPSTSTLTDSLRSGYYLGRYFHHCSSKGCLHILKAAHRVDFVIDAIIIFILDQSHKHLSLRCRI
jgi:hypothetical protein